MTKEQAERGRKAALAFMKEIDPYNALKEFGGRTDHCPEYGTTVRAYAAAVEMMLDMERLLSQFGTT